jgi:hypothetical protein
MAQAHDGDVALYRPLLRQAQKARERGGRDPVEREMPELESRQGWGLLPVTTPRDLAGGTDLPSAIRVR